MSATSLPLESPSGTARGILVVDDHDLVRLGLRTLLVSQATSVGVALEVLEARTLQSAIEVHRQHAARIGLVLLDLNLPDSRGLTGLQAFLAECRGARVVVLSGSTDPGLTRRAIELGASAFLPKSADLQSVLDYLHREGFFGTEADAPASGDTATAADSESADTEVWTAGGQRIRLTRRQADVLERILAGHSNRQIAEQTRLSEGTIKNHVSALLLMFGVRSRAQLISQLR